MATLRRRLSTERSWGVEAQLRARSAQLKREPETEPKLSRQQVTEPRGTPLGCCHRCSEVIYGGDRLAMVGGYLVHDDCALRTP